MSDDSDGDYCPTPERCQETKSAVRESSTGDESGCGDSDGDSTYCPTPERRQGKTVLRGSPVQSKVNPTGVLGFIPVYLTVGTPQCEQVPSAAGNQPVASLSAINQPVASVSACNQPVASMSAGNQPVASVSAGNQPVASVSAGNQPVASVFAGNQPVASVSVGNQPVASVSARGKLDGIVLPNQTAFVQLSQLDKFVESINGIRGCKTPGCDGNLVPISVKSVGLGGGISV